MSTRWWLVLLVACAPHREVIDDSPAAYVGEVEGELHVSFAAPADVGATWRETDGLRVGEQVVCARTASRRMRCELAYDPQGRAIRPRRLLRDHEKSVRLTSVELSGKQDVWT